MIKEDEDTPEVPPGWDESPGSKLEEPVKSPGIEPIRHPVVAWILFVVLPLAMLLFIFALSQEKTLTGEIVKRQFVNCYVAWPVLIGLLAFTTAGFAGMTTQGLTPIRLVSLRPFRFGIFLFLLMFLGQFFMKTELLSHAWFGWSLEQRIKIFGLNLAMGFGVSIVYLTLFPMYGGVRDLNMRRVAVIIAFSFWGYLFASLFRMFPLFVAVE